ncbi:MAG: CDP-alcohol phosphatidyltransferase family protein [Faecousia sp.]
MSILNWKKEVFTIPNFLSFFRLLLIPVYVFLYLTAESTQQYVAAGLILALSCLTDMIDGRIARKCNMISTLGMLLDPVADKATQAALLVCLSMKYPVLYPVLVLLVIKESFQLFALIIAYLNGKMLPGALFIGKLCTTVLFVSLIAMVLFPELPGQVVDLIAMVDACFLGVSFVCYICAYYGKNKKVQDMNSNL